MNTKAKVTPFQSVADLVAPMSFLNFHKEYWGKGFHYFPATDERRAQAMALFNLESFLESVFKVHVRDTRLSLSHDGKKLPEHENAFAIEKLSWKTRPNLEQLENLCASKSTLIFNSIEIGWQELTDFCRNSMQILGESVNMNAYFSPANGVLGLGCHYDIQEHFIIQFSGKKTWRMYEGLEPNPTEKLFFDQGSAQRRPIDKAYQDITVEPGDVLYFSRGQWHEPIPTDEHSLHLTVTVPITFQFQAIQWVIKKLSASEELRKALPMILEDPASHEAFIKEVEVARLAALEIIQSPDFSRQAFFDKFQESFAITSDHRGDTE